MAKTLTGTQINSGTVWSLRDVEMYQKRYKVIQIQWASRKKGYHTIFNSYRKLGTVGVFTYYDNNLGRILNNITSHGSIKQNRCKPWQE
jgi:hypothetical protein